MEPDSRRSASCGRLSSRFSTARESWDSAMIGTFSSLARAFMLVVICDTSCTRLSDDCRAEPVMQLQIVDDDQAQALLALEAAGARGKLGDGDAAGLIDEQREAGHFLAGLDQALELGLVDHAAADLLRRDAGLLGHDARGELLGRHFEREEADDRAVVARIARAEVRSVCASDCARARATLKAMLVTSAVLPMEGRPARMIRSDGCRPPILPSSAGEAPWRCRTGARRAGRRCGHLDGVVRRW